MPSVLWGAASGADVCVPFYGYSTLSACRLLNAGAADDDVALAWDPSPVDANTLLKYQMDEAAWNGTPGEVIDGSGNGYHGTASNANTVLGALDRYGDMGVVASTDHVLTPTIPWPATFALEFWAYHVKPNVNAFLLGGSDTTDRQCQLRCNVSADPTNWEWRAFSAAKYFTVTNNAWHHWTLQATRNGGVAQAWIDGVNVMDSASGTGAAGNITFGFGKAAGYAAGADSLFDDVRLSNVLRRGSAANFTPPVWIKSATQNGGVQPYVQSGITGLSGMLPTVVSWTAQTGSTYGRIHSVWAQDAALGWTQVGGAYPTSPVAITGVSLADDNSIRVALEPEAVSGIQNASPTLYTVRLDYDAPVTGYGRPRYSRILSGALTGLLR